MWFRYFTDDCTEVGINRKHVVSTQTNRDLNRQIIEVNLLYVNGKTETIHGQVDAQAFYSFMFGDSEDPSLQDKSRADRYREIVATWLEAYPEDQFIPLPSSKDESDEMKQYRTRASADMGRHMARAILKQFAAADEEMEEE